MASSLAVNNIMSPAGWRKPVVPFLISIDEPSLGESISKEVAGCVCVLGGGSGAAL